MEAATPGEELMTCALRDRRVNLDAKLTETVNALLTELAEGQPYQLHMTMGYARCTDPAQPAEYYMKAADDMLYQRKKAASIGR